MGLTRPVLVYDRSITKIWAKALFSSLLLIYTLREANLKLHLLKFFKQNNISCKI